ncbi:MAG: GAF domain-containing sensor histidine kinase [Acidimicrobiia bacterium]
MTVTSASDAHIHGDESDASTWTRAPALEHDDERVAALRSYQVLDTDPEHSFDRITQLVASALDVPMALVSLVEDERQWFKSVVGLDASETPRDVSFCGHAITGDELFVVHDAAQDERFACNPLSIGAPYVKFYAGAPLVTSDGYRIGTLCAIDTKARPELSESERQLLTTLAATVVDELELRRANTKLRVQAEELEGYAHVIDASLDFIGTADHEGRALWVNEAGMRMVGREGEDPTQMMIANFHPEWAQQLVGGEGIPSSIANGSWHHETALLSASGREIPVDQVIICHRDDEGEIAFFSTIARDISDREEIQRLLALQKLKDEFVATVSHELRTPLTSIFGSLGLLSGGAVGELSPAVLEMVTMARSNSERLVRLINDLLDLQKMQSGTIELTPSDEQIEDLVVPALEAVEGLDLERGTRVTWENEFADGSLVHCDRERIVQVLVNLMANAIKFSPPHSQVQVRTTRANADELSIEIIDRGPGIAAVDLPRLFDPFWQSDSSSTRHVGGTGLGLSIANAIVEQHGGRIEVDSVEGEGSIFRVLLPIGVR